MADAPTLVASDMTIVIDFKRCPICFRRGASLHLPSERLAVSCPTCGEFTLEIGATGPLLRARQDAVGLALLERLSEDIRQRRVTHITKAMWLRLLEASTTPKPE